ncbi:3-isopropylmalate dehydrogenase [Candidatus Karelsulcia muelleri]|uniref:3-isopropylmalate dehydrogenase n=1 Tax=Candidatus Karelsulcia muelleri TaxID=336810 RepID=A0A346E141_9FLAO|nr:3-isopropylmalate dehydrogenase [Candidatus Karelsulcia muelleri]AXN02696.1 3-isopropylmalate dehydrogenase [Candidatus Karelsulcia muelleri]WDI79488.1 3-isopropylmalate dehydrogenase [Candidatus Karelsulcia muelleri]WDR78946.1 3-isopropylmalate dehydrogenase [Candidatus Karelsulcia muelleri]
MKIMVMKIAILPGDGIGPEILVQSLKVLKAISLKFGHKFLIYKGLIGAESIKKKGLPITKETINICKSSDTILLGAVGDPLYDNDPTRNIRPEQGLLELRKKLCLYCNMRPIKTYNKLLKVATIKQAVIKNVNFVIFRELTSGIYFGNKWRSKYEAYDICTYNKHIIKKIAIKAFETARKRKQKITLVDKANVLETSRLWRETVKEIAQENQDIKVDYIFIDNASMQIVLQPRQFDILLTDNMFGDILSDEASVLVGSLGLLPSVSFGNHYSLYEPVHGSFTQAKGKNIANPLGSILSVSLMLENFGFQKESFLINRAVTESINLGITTKDINTKNPCTTSAVGDFLFSSILKKRKRRIR